MSVTDANVIDAIGTVAETGVVVLSVADHLEWGNQADEHLIALQNKLNTYLRFIESGEIYTSFPSAKGKEIAVRVYFKYEPDDSGRHFMAEAEDVLRGAGIGLQAARLTSDPH